jgi:hypothetical protein
LSFPLADFTVSFKEIAVGSVGAKITTQPTGANTQQHATDTRSWHLYPVTVAEGYSAAIAVEGKVDKIEMWGL